MAPLRVAVLGYGLAGRVFHCPFVSAVPGLELAAIVQRHGDDAARDWPGATVLRSAEAAFADPTLDLIVVGTPDSTHFDLAAAALRAGKHVVVDKPLATSSAAVEELIAIARDNGKLLCPFQNRRWDGDFLTVAKLLREGTLGRVVEITSRFDRFRPIPKANTWKEAGGNEGGLLFDLGSHLVDQALALFGAPDRVTGTVRRERDTTAIDDFFTLTLEYDSAALAGGPLRYTCAATMLAAAPSPRFAVHGTLGSYIKHGLDPQEPTVLGGRRPPMLGSEEPWLPEAEAHWGALTLAPDPARPSELDLSPVRTETGDYRCFYANVRDVIVEGAPLAVTADDALRMVRLLERASDSSRERRTL